MFQLKLVNYFCYLIITIWIISSTCPALAQDTYQRHLIAGLPEFKYDIFNINSNLPNRSELNFIIEIAYDDLQFIKNDSGFTAAYDLSISINTKEEEQIEGSSWTRTILVKDYETTNSRDLYSFINASYQVPPGNYKVIIRMTDKDTHLEFVQKSEVLVQNFNKEKLAISDLILTEQIIADTMSKKVIPQFLSTNIRGKKEQLTFYYEIYSQKVIPKFKVTCKLKNNRNKKIQENKYEVAKTGSCTPAYLNIDTKQLSMGRYFLTLTVEDGSNKKSIDKNFILHWHGMPNTIFDLETAIDQLKYIAQGDQIADMKKAKGKEKETLFEKFWIERDPTPGTKANEHLEEYYRRIDYANEAFKGFHEGWKSDRGMVFIILGEPNDIERHPFEQGSKPYQIWYYYEQNRRFIFVDETGFGDYRLAYGWEDLYRDMRWRP